MKLISLQYSKETKKCESCGHDIKNLCFLDNNGIEMMVGTECLAHLIGHDAATRYERYLQKAAREWQKSEKTEDRETFINRRAKELLTAFRAWKESKAIKKHHWSPEYKSAIAAIEQKYNLPRQLWEGKTAYTI
ncbi:MAG: hypothetical protein J2P36_08300 [Ktedonobacteraceae bacterium]|nr:hypothetical protein [Ktedonobacteraceae bacterium]